MHHKKQTIENISALHQRQEEYEFLKTNTKTKINQSGQVWWSTLNPSTKGFEAGGPLCSRFQRGRDTVVL